MSKFKHFSTTKRRRNRPDLTQEERDLVNTGNEILNGYDLEYKKSLANQAIDHYPDSTLRKEGTGLVDLDKFAKRGNLWDG